MGHLTFKGREARLRLVRQGVPILEIARRFGVERQAVDQFIRGNGLYETWKKSNEYFLANRQNVESKKEMLERQRKSSLETLASQVNEVLLRKVDELSLSQKKAYDMACAYKNRQSNGYSFSFLFDFYSHVNGLTQRKEKFSYGDLAKRFSIYSSAARRLLLAFDLKSTNNKNSTKRLTYEQKTAIRNGLNNTLWGYYDIAYFSGRVSHVTVKNVHDLGPNGRVVTPDDLFFSDFGCRGKVTPRRASQIYELLDSGMNYSEIKKKLKISDQVLYNSVENRGRYSEDIINNLRKIYPEREIVRPYL